MLIEIGFLWFQKLVLKQILDQKVGFIFQILSLISNHTYFIVIEKQKLDKKTE